jgi:hypothetical protein
MDQRTEEFAHARVAREGAGKNPGGDRGQESDEKIICDGSLGVYDAEFVVG